ANSTITKDISSGSIARGTPAKASEYHVVALSTDERLVKLHEIMKEYADFARYQGHESLVSEILHNQFRIETDGVVANFGRNTDADLSIAKMFICVERIDAIARARCDKAGIVWFDIDSAEARMSAHSMAVGIYEFLGRYGIRFARN
ncbi:MAG: hypothetical protein Q8S09_04030, partial [Hyphomonas sp.]|nr:hypothetical protein [Hyphomonas sp.]